MTKVNDKAGPRTRRSLPLRARLGALTIVLVATWSPPRASAQEPAANRDWLRVPEASLAGLEEPVARQLTDLRELVVAQVAGPDTSPAELGEALGELGRHYHAYQLLDAADECYAIARRLAPEDFRWPYLAGYLSQSAGRLEEAVERYERALQIVPEVPPALVRLGEAYLELNRPGEAQAVLEAALRLNPDSAAALAAIGRVYQSAGRHQDAVAALERALELAPSADLLYYPLGLAYRALGATDKALDALSKRGEIGVRPADPLVDGLAGLTTGERVHLLRGRAAFEASRFAEAAEEFRRAVEARPESARARINLAAALAETGEVEAAIAELEEAVRLAPGNADAYFNLASLHERRGEHEQAVERFAEAVRYRSDDAESRARFADALRRVGRLEEALSHYGRAVELDPGAETARLGEADVLSRLGRFREARARLESAHQAIPNSGLIAHGLARLLAACPDGSLRDGERALDLATQVFEARRTLSHALTVAMALAELGRCEEAADWQQQVAQSAEESGDQTAAAEFEAVRATYAAGPPCRPPIDDLATPFP